MKQANEAEAKYRIVFTSKEIFLNDFALDKIGRSSRLLFAKSKWGKSTNILKMRSLGVQILCVDCIGILSLLGV